MSAWPGRRGAIVALAFAGAVFLLFASMPPPSQATHTFPRKLTIKYADGKFKGRFKSPSAECRAGLVTVHKRVRGGSDPIVATDLANGRGKWAARKPGARGQFYASAESFTGSAGNCPDVRSGLVSP